MRILVAEDDKVSLRLLETKLTEWNYDYDLAEDGMEAWQKLTSLSADIVITDRMMPRMDGIELCRKIRGIDFKHYIYIILLTARDSKKEVIEGLEAGADDYLTKPVNFDELRERIEIGVRIVRLEQELNQKLDSIKKNYFQTIKVFSNLIETFNENMGGHSRRVSRLSIQLAEKHPDVSAYDIKVVEAAALLHDIGMIGSPMEIITKKITELNGDEKKLYWAHPIQGEIILQEIEFLKPIAKLVRSHHEQVNGRGFPDGLTGSEVPLLAQIIATADTYDNLIYKWEIHPENIHEHIQLQRGYQLEPALVDYLLEINLENIQKEREINFKEIFLNDLRKGMILAKDIRMKSGSIAMPSGMEITNQDIKKLQAYLDLDCIANTLHIYKNY